MAVLVARTLDFNNATRIVNLPDGTLPQHPATVAQLNSAIEGLAWKDSVRVAADANVTIATPGAAIDGITLTSGDRVLLRGQTAGETNGIYTWNGAATAMTRAADMSAAAEVEQATVSVEEGTNAGTSFRQSAVNVTLDTTPLVFAAFGTAAGAASATSSGIVELATQAEVNAGTDTTRVITPETLAGSTFAHRGFAANVGDAASTSIAVTHNLNSFDVSVDVFRNSGSRDTVVTEVQRTSVNVITLLFDVAPTLNQFRVIIARVA